ncbi:hypothetical protein [Pendulispora albinea]|uniref:Uncharacterized protein n=1 Tax=Pendulispora albinea TaxID=2741071 RepID=A0ABZ2M4M7_9BACT
MAWWWPVGARQVTVAAAAVLSELRGAHPGGPGLTLHGRPGAPPHVWIRGLSEEDLLARGLVSAESLDPFEARILLQLLPARAEDAVTRSGRCSPISCKWRACPAASTTATFG